MFSRLFGTKNEHKTVFFIRHGQSVWNKAQAGGNIIKMLGDTDHPLSEEGCRQAEALRQAISDCKEAWLKKDFKKPDAVYVSPLTRAMQTAAIGLEDILSARTNIIVKADAREKRHRFGYDSVGKACGSDIVRRTREELMEAYQCETSAIENLDTLVLDLKEVQEPWWATSGESKDQVALRSDEFMKQLLNSPHKRIIVVGHSHFFRELFKNHQNESFKEAKPELAATISQEVIQNCGVVKVLLDTSAVEAPIVDMEFVFGSDFAKRK